MKHYCYCNNKEFIKSIRRFTGKLMQEVCHILKEDYNIGAIPCLVGSGANNLIMQNGIKPIDLDYNLEIIKLKKMEYRELKECVRKAFNKALSNRRLSNCQDSKSVLSTGIIVVNKNLYGKDIFCSTVYDLNVYPANCFYIDVCIIRKSKNNIERLIHEKTGNIYNDKYYWNIAPDFNKIYEKVKYIKKKDKWEELKIEYEKIKNIYFNDRSRPSFICYIESINNVYNSIKII